jgi:N-acetyl-gamma-glutamyl-phosphate reductase
LAEGLISRKGIIIDAKSGASGAGRRAEVEYGFCEVDENLKAYGVTTHRHASEIEEKLGEAAKAETALSFTPHLLPIKRGILATIYTELKISDAGAGKKISDAYAKYYGGERFVTVFSEGVLPEIKWVSGTNSCFIGFKLDPKNGRAIIISCIDNLIKGAAGQAVQNMNVMLGFREEEGLS